MVYLWTVEKINENDTAFQLENAGGGYTLGKTYTVTIKLQMTGNKTVN